MNNVYRHGGKRLFDLALAVPSLIILSPLLAFIALLVRIRLGSPVLFRQQRPGLRGKPFTIYKFRTMTDARDAEGNLLPDIERLTSLGRLLRTTSLDELPELLNVLQGDMSLVGPRPLLMDYLRCYTPRERTRHDVRPGITGLAQVNGRNLLLWDDRLELDVQYVNALSLRLDFTILWNTLWKVLRRKDVIAVPGTQQGPLTRYRNQRS